MHDKYIALHRFTASGVGDAGDVGNVGDCGEAGEVVAASAVAQDFLLCWREEAGALPKATALENLS